MTARITSLGELIARRELERDGDGYMPGQLDIRVLDPRPHRDRADLAAIVTFVDSEGALWDVTCFHYRDERGWKAIKAGRYGLKKTLTRTHTAAALGFELGTAELAALEAASSEVDPFPYEEPSADERHIRALAHRLIDRAAREAEERRR